MNIASVGIDLGRGSPGVLGEHSKVLLRKKFSRVQLLAYTPTSFILNCLEHAPDRIVWERYCPSRDTRYA
jgi:hypothetical protein